MKNLLKTIAAKLPRRYQRELKRKMYRRQIRKGDFDTKEAEFGKLASWVNSGDWVLDVGANVGHYTCRFSDLVGKTGRVIALEPVPETFELLAANVAAFPHNNVTLLNVAASDEPAVQGICIPKFDSGLDNLYEARLADGQSELSVLCLTIDSFNFPRPIHLAKIDAEGHELSVLRGMRSILERDHPLLIVEDNSPDITEYLVEKFGYVASKETGSPNRVFTYS